MVIGKVQRSPETAPLRAPRGALRTLIGILGDVAQVTGIGIRYF